MAVILKKKVSPKNATAMVVDRIVALRKEIEAISPQQKEYDKLVKDLRTQAMEQDPDQIVAFEGTDVNLIFGEAAHTRAVKDMLAAKKALGNEVFFKVAKITLGDLDKYLTPEELGELVEEGRGARKIDFVEK